MLTVLAGLTVTSPASPARANGLYTHIHISQLAAAELPPGPLRDLIHDPMFVPMYEAGSMFPDSGYAVDHEYGEEAHWPRFTRAFQERLIERYGTDYSSTEAREMVAFFLGFASHGMADQLYDHRVLRRAIEVDGDTGEVDREADYFIVIDNDVRIFTEAWAPYPQVVTALDDVGIDAMESNVMDGMGLAEFAVWVQRSAAYNGYVQAWQRYPWLGTHLYNEDVPGSLPDLGKSVAEYWRVLYARLQGTDDMDSDLLVDTVPRDGAVNWPVDASDGSTLLQISMAIGYGVRREQAFPLIRLVDESGATVPATLHTPYETSGYVNMVMIRPTGTLEYDHEYTVEVSAGIQNVAGEETTSPYTFSFRTRCAPESLTDCPPLAEPWVTGEIPTAPPSPVRDMGPSDADAGTDAGPQTPDLGTPPSPRGGGGCGVAQASTPSARSTAAAWVLLLLAAVAFGRRRLSGR